MTEKTEVTKTTNEEEKKAVVGQGVGGAIEIEQPAIKTIQEDEDKEK